MNIEARPWRRLSPHQMRFVAEYLRDGNGSRAARAAGYSSRDADVYAERLLANPDVAAEVDRRRAVIAEAAERTLEDHVRRLEGIAYAEYGNYIRVTEDGLAALDLSAATPEELAAIAEIQSEEISQGRGEDSQMILKTKIKLLSPLEALRDLAKIKGYNAAEKHELSGPGGAPVRVEDIGRVSPAEAMQAYLEMIKK